MPKKKTTVLTARERQILTLIGNNKKYKEIAAELGLAYETVKTYVARIKIKLNLDSKLELALYAHRQGWIK
jgi:NarL family two-component system response regulator LiaR